MHLMTFMEVRKATPALRGLVFIGQVRHHASLSFVGQESEQLSLTVNTVLFPLHRRCAW
jgi:hypothetical protein